MFGPSGNLPTNPTAQYHDMWDLPSQVGVPSKAVCSQTKVSTVSKPKQSALVQSEHLSPPIPADLPFMDAVDLPDPGEPALPLLKPGCRKESVFALSKDYLITDRVLPAPAVSLVKHTHFAQLGGENLTTQAHRFAKGTAQNMVSGIRTWFYYCVYYQQPILPATEHLERLKVQLLVSRAISTGGA